MNFKKTAALLLAISFLTPSFALIACKNAPSASVDSEQTDELEPLPETSEDSESIETPPTEPPETSEPETPSAPTPPSQPSTPAPPSNSENTDTVKPTVSQPQYIRCTGDNVNLRAGAGTDYAVVGQAEKGETYAVIGKTGKWYKTYYRNKTVYFYASYASVFTLEKSDNEKAERVIEEGYKLIGTPYVYGAARFHDGNGKLLGGFSVHKFDCSSLIQYIFYKGANKLLQVNTRTQVRQGKYVKPSDLQRGDCIFFTNESRQHLTGIERVGHVALYLGGEYILHTSSDYARIEKMTATRWNYYIEARRFV